MTSMTEYHYNEQFYRELVIDYNYRFPKFMEISYPNLTEEDDNLWLNFHGLHSHLVGLL